MIVARSMVEDHRLVLRSRQNFRSFPLNTGSHTIFFFFLSFSLSFRDYNSSLNPLPNLACPSIFQSQLEDRYVLDIYLENIIIIDFKMYRIFFQLLIFSIYNWRIVIHFLIFFVNNDTSTIKAIRTEQTFEFLTYRMKNARNIFSIIIP